MGTVVCVVFSYVDEMLPIMTDQGFTVNTMSETERSESGRCQVVWEAGLNKVKDK